MALPQAMYPAINNSPQTRLANLISATDQTIELVNAGVLPAGPNIATIGVEDNAELIRYSGISGNTLTGCIRGFNGTLAQVWFADERVYRAYTTADHESFRANITSVDGRLTALEGTALQPGSDGSSLTASFTQASARDNVQSGATLGVLFGRVMRWFADLRDGAFAAFGTGGNDIARGNHTHAQYLTAETDPTVPAWAKAAAKPTYTAAETGAVPTSRKVAGKELSADVTLSPVDVGAAAAVHTHAQYLTEEADPTVPAWAKAAAKPAYTADEVGAVTLAEGKALAAQTSADVVAVTGAYTLALADAGRLIEIDSAGATTITIPADTTVNFPIGTEIEITQEGAGEVTVAAAGGVMLRSAGDRVMIAEQYTAAVLKKRAANDWRMWGALK